MSMKVGLSGFGRMVEGLLKSICRKEDVKDFELVAINASGDP